MTSPYDETTAYAGARTFEPAPGQPPVSGRVEDNYGPDEERLVAMARAEAVLRLARAL
jgi:hypothetical protein